MKNLKLNYQELAFIMDISSEESKEVFREILDKDVVKKSEEVDCELLSRHFGLTKSVDPRYDNKNKLFFYVKMKKDNYKKYLETRSFVKKLKMTGGKSIFYKILSKKDLFHLENSLKRNHIEFFGIKSYEKICA